MNTQNDRTKEFLLSAINEKNEDFYVRRFTRFMKNQLIFPSWNWAAFIFGMGWLLYRKMPGVVLLYIVSMSASHLYIVQKFDIYVGLAYYLIVAKVLVPSYANQIYYLRIIFTLKRLRSKQLSATEIKETLKDRFGVLTQVSSTNPQIF